MEFMPWNTAQEWIAIKSWNVQKILMNLNIIMLCKKGRRTTEYYVIPFIWNFRKMQTKVSWQKWVRDKFRQEVDTDSGRRGSKRLQRHMRELWMVMGIFIILMMVIFLMYTYVIRSWEFSLAELLHGIAISASI